MDGCSLAAAFENIYSRVRPECCSKALRSSVEGSFSMQ